MLIDCFAGDLTSERGVIDAPVALFPSEGTSLRIKQIPPHIRLDKHLEGSRLAGDGAV